MSLELVRRLASLDPELELCILATPQNLHELRALERGNVRCITIGSAAPLARQTSRRANQLLECLPERLHALALRGLLSARARLRAAHNPVLAHHPDALLCPFTVPRFGHPTLPTLSIVYDLQHAELPQFFGTTELVHREHNLRQACRLASRIVCISDFVRQTVLARYPVAPERVLTIHIQMASRLPPGDQATKASLLASLGLSEDGYLLYPANFWEHKNHLALLTAMGIFLARHAESKLKLVCTGAPGARMDEVRGAAAKMNLGGQVLFPGYLAEAELAALLHGCRALIFPSLYEGFGMPVIEAMAAGKPVLCSNAASLPEVAGDAALFFDPALPAEIAVAIERIETDAALRKRLVHAGYANAARFSDANRMAAEYLGVLKALAGQGP